MAAFGILAALRERERSGEGQLVDVSMFDGALAWLAMVAAQLPRRRRGRRERGDARARRAARSATGRTPASDGWVTLGALEPKFWQAWCRGVGREDLIEKQFEPPGSDAHAEVERDLRWSARATSGASSPRSTTAASSRCSTSTRRSTRSSCGRARWWWSSTSPAPDGVRLLGVPVKLSRTPGRAGRPRARRSASTRARCSPALGYSEDEIAALEESGRWPARRGRRGASWRERTNGLLKMKELAEASGVSAGTIKHYLREGLLPEPVKTSRNMAYYPPEFVERIRLIKQLQEERFMPLKVIKGDARRRPRARPRARGARGPDPRARARGRPARASRPPS